MKIILLSSLFLAFAKAEVDVEELEHLLFRGAERELLVFNSKCEAHKKCFDLGLEGDCCPASNGFFRNCCNSAKCIKYPGCKDDFAGNCCPTNNGEILDCCYDLPKRPRAIRRACEDNDKCSGSGDCCPNEDGEYESCCEGTCTQLRNFCLFEDECCNDLRCIKNTCRRCNRRMMACQASTECCDNLRCNKELGICEEI